MPEPLRPGQRYIPGLDGLRALAVAAVIAYHLGFGWASGGLLGVGVFFTLSGYLITDLLLGQLADHRLALTEFWLRRARRLLPGLFVMLVVVTVWVWIADRSQMHALRGQFASAVLYVNNWWQISQHVSYFARFGPPSPLNHLWSLSVEEQFYILWPWLLLLGVHFVKERKRRFRLRPRLAVVTLIVSVASAIEMAVMFHPSFDPSRLYDGTDTRAFGLLVGAALAMVWPSRELTPRVTAGARNVLDVIGTFGLLAIAVLVWKTNQYSPFLYHGGLVALSLATVLVVAVLVHPASRLGHLLGWRPLRWLGVRSYGIYLWHAPIIVLTTPNFNQGVNPIRAVLQVGASVGLAALSWRFVEEPVRQGGLGRLRAQARAVAWRPRRLPAGTRAGLAAAAVAVLLAGTALAGIGPPAPITSAMATINPQPHTLATSGTSLPPAPVSHRKSRRERSAHRALPPAGRGRTHAASRSVRAGAGATGPPQSAHTSCRSVVHVGDSTSEGLISSDYLPARSQRLVAQYARVGVKHVQLEITGATSIVETLPGGINAYKVARDLRNAGYRGCWVIALGTNDTADIYVGSSIPLSQRIKRMMSVIGSQPVMWVNAKTLVSSGPYAESNMQLWNQALVDACSGYPNLRVYDWAAVVKDKWFIPDGIHYYSPGYAARAHLIADALANAFPAHKSSAVRGCVVQTGSISLPVLGVHH